MCLFSSSWSWQALAECPPCAGQGRQWRSQSSTPESSLFGTYRHDQGKAWTLRAAQTGEVPSQLRFCRGQGFLVGFLDCSQLLSLGPKRHPDSGCTPTLPGLTLILKASWLVETCLAWGSCCLFQKMLPPGMRPEVSSSESSQDTDILTSPLRCDYTWNLPARAQIRTQVRQDMEKWNFLKVILASWG